MTITVCTEAINVKKRKTGTRLVMHKIDLFFLIIAVCFKVINPGGAGLEAMLEEKDSTSKLMNYFELPG
jgi:hypothetical protein